MLTFLLVDPGSPVRGPSQLSDLRQMWADRKIHENTHLFLTWRNFDTNDRLCANIRAGQIKQSLESETDIDVDAFR